MKPIFFLVLISQLVLGTSHATTLKELGRGVGNDLASPVTTRAKYVFYSGVGLTLAFVLLKKEISFPLQTDLSKHPPLGKSSVVGDNAGQLFPNLAYAGGMLLSGALGNQDNYKRAEIMALSTLYSGMVTNILKNTIHEDRPGNGNKKSFPSGHTTTVFAFASVVAAEHPLYFGIPAYALAAFSGFSRMNDNRHYLHDVIGGMTIGISYGLGIHYLRRATEGSSAANSGENKFDLFAAPTERWDGGIFLAGGRF